MKKKRKSIIQEFKVFITKGNVIDLAVGMIIGAAFTSIVSSLVNDIIMPFIAWLIGKTQFSDLAWVLIPDKLAADGVTIIKGVKIMYGNFIQNIVNFLLIAIVVFLLVKIINTIRKKIEDKKLKEEAKEVPTVTVPEDVKVLKEIKELLENMNQTKKE